ncbi:MAG TPA: MFS transporter [Longimicrobium sp.]|nr:MFS transporter [Longimicrobium sp.]
MSDAPLHAPTASAATVHEPSDRRTIWKVIVASAVGTMIEWYDFYIFGSLATLLAGHFFPTGNTTLALLQTLATFAAGFAARPFGALFFGRIGDLVGRKYAFLVTLLIMGGATFVIGLLPGYATIGVAAPLILLLLRLVQGLALGGEYGGAATYVAEHVPDNRRGFYTAFIQTTATLGLLLSLLVILAVRSLMPTEDWERWGWRIPFLLSSVLVLVSLFIRLRLRESPLFTQMKAAGKTSTRPIAESFGSAGRWQTMLIVLWGAAAGQAVVWYTGQFYALTWLENVGKVDFVDTRTIIAVALVLATPFFIVFGALSDRIGRKKVMMAGNLLAAVLTIPIFQLMWRFTPAGGSYNPVALTACVFVLVIFVTIVYGPIAAFLVESFPARVRYTSVSLPYHVGNGYFGGFLPVVATAMVAFATADPEGFPVLPRYAGLLYPVAVALITFVLGTVLLRETKDVRIDDEHHAGVETRVRPGVLGLLIALTAGALVLADRYLLPTFTPAGEPPYVQYVFRGLMLIVLLAVILPRLGRRGR